jgi:RNA polymerase sigma factor (sigma-70 family)
MTAPSDAQLVSGVLAGDRDAFAAVYDRYADRLHDFAYSMLRHREDAADAVADAFVTTAERLEQLRDPDRLRPWLYAVVRRECLARLKARSRTAYGGDEDLLDLPDQAAAPETVAEQESLRALVWDAAAGLNERDRAMLDLHVRQGLDGAELGEALGMSADNAYVSLSRLRDQVERSIGALLVARTSRHDCGGLTEVLDDWDGEFTPLVRKRVARHVDRCAACTARRAVVASPAALLAGVPAFAAPLVLRERVLEDTRLVSALEARSTGTRPGGGAGAGPGAATGRRRRGTRRVAATAVALLLAVVAGLVWQGRDQDPSDLVADDLDASTSATPSGAPSTSPTPVPTPVPTPEPTAPVPPPVSGPSEEPTLEVSGTPTEEVSPEVTDSPTQPTPSEPDDPTPTPDPGRLVAAPRALDLGGSGARTVTLRNTGGSPLDFTVSPDDGWLSVRPSSGTLKPGASREITVSADRAGLAEGSTAGSVSVRWDGRTTQVAVSASRNVGPVIGALSPLQADCDAPVTLTVPISDESGIASATVAWSGPSTGSKALTLRGSVYFASIGTVAPGTLQLTVTATDTLGNVARRSGSFVVNPCPQ